MVYSISNRDWQTYLQPGRNCRRKSSQNGGSVDEGCMLKVRFKWLGAIKRWEPRSLMDALSWARFLEE